MKIAQWYIENSQKEGWRYSTQNLFVELTATGRGGSH